MLLPIAVATVRNGVEKVLCTCYPFLEQGGYEGKELLASLHEVITRVCTVVIPLQCQLSSAGWPLCRLCPSIVPVKQCRLPAISPVTSLGTDEDKQSSGSMRSSAGCR